MRRKRNLAKQQGIFETPCIGNSENSTGTRRTKDASSGTFVRQQVPSRIIQISQDALREVTEDIKRSRRPDVQLNQSSDAGWLAGWLAFVRYVNEINFRRILVL